MINHSRKHSHKFTIADQDAVHTLVGKMVTGGKQQKDNGNHLLLALDDAARHYEDSSQKVRQAFFHGLLTGYAVALKLIPRGANLRDSSFRV